jgi:two-component system chemotaxis response regulator CheB
MTIPVRVLVVDDSPTARVLLSETLASEPGITVVGEARNGEEAIEAARRLRPSLITMDVYMPIMDGLAATREIMIAAPTPIVIVSSAVNRGEVNLSLEATAAGALTVIGKSDGPLSPEFETWRAEFVGLIKAMAQVKVVRRWNRKVSPPYSVVRSEIPLAVRPARVAAIVASTGGPAVLQRIVKELPGDFAIPILLVQHIAHGFVDGLADWLSAATQLRVKVARDRERVQRGTIYIAPNDQHLGVRADHTVLLSSAPHVGGFRPAGTFLFESIARVYGPSALAVIMTGMGSDGVDGLRSVRAAGGQSIAQEESSCVVYGMPREAVRAGVVDAILSPGEILEYLIALHAGGVDAGQRSSR